MKRSDPAAGKHVVLGASPNPSRYAYMAVMMLLEYGYDAVPVGIRAGNIEKTTIRLFPEPVSNVHTVTLYVGPERQRNMYSYILGLNPRRIVFNPGTYNEELARMAEEKGIETTEGCSLVMLRTGAY